MVAGCQPDPAAQFEEERGINVDILGILVIALQAIEAEHAP